MKPITSTDNGPTQGIVLFAHGSGDPDWASPIKAIQAELMRRYPEKMTVIAYLERASPCFLEAATELALHGITKIELLPVFLGVGKHLKADLPILLSEFSQLHPQVSVNQLPAIGENQGFAPWVASLFDSTEREPSNAP